MHWNPWTAVPLEPPFVLSDDRPALARSSALTRTLKLDFLPVPFQGAADAPVLLLSLNPGGRTNDTEFGEAFVEERRRGLRFEADFPFWCLNPAFAATDGYRYWNARLRLLLERLGRPAVANGLLLVQYFPYQSVEWKPLKEILPSQRFGFALVRQAIAAGKPIVVMRSRRIWNEAVPELADYTGAITLRNPRGPYLTPRNMGTAAFESIVERLAQFGETSKSA